MNFVILTTGEAIHYKTNPKRYSNKTHHHDSTIIVVLIIRKYYTVEIFEREQRIFNRTQCVRYFVHHMFCPEPYIIIQTRCVQNEHHLRFR